MTLTTAHLSLLLSFILLSASIIALMLFPDKKSYLLGRFEKNRKKIFLYQYALRKIITKRNLHDRLTIDRKRSFRIYLEQLTYKSTNLQQMFSELEDKNADLKDPDKYLEMLSIQEEEIGLLKAEIYILKSEKRLSA